MEDPNGESELEEDSPEENCGKVRWILNKGWGLGKKVLVTGMVISSAPIVLPPLVVISAIGLALSVPSGVVLASYACSEKIMSKLLPYIEPPPLFENNVTLMCREMRVEFVDEETGDIIEEDAQGNVTEDVNEIEFVEENGYEEDVDDSTDEVEELILDSIYEVKIKGLSEDFKDDSVLDENQVDEVCGLVFNVVEGDVQMGVIPIEGSTVAIKESEGQERVNDIVEEAELVEETRGLLEKIRDEGNTDNAMEMDKQYVGENEGGGELINQKIARIADIGSQESTNTREGGVADIPDECEGMQGFQEMRFANDAKTVYEDVKPVRDIGSVLESTNAENDLAAEKPIVETKNVNDVLVEEKSRAKTRNLKPLASSFTEDKQKLVINKEEIVQGRRTDDTINELEFQLIREKEIVVSNADAREIADESGLHLFDEKNESLPVSSIACESTDSGISSGKDVTMPSHGVLYDETKIWAKIDAIQSIVGYKGTPHATYIEELKALYLFTGVEHPTVSFSNPPDLAQVNHKLRFLMSIIGVKLDS
ncbi:hypothetical protein D8674_007485 [Pyrus ussuriensis x Pyrus communis]|uniref:Uncharacterized protein n=1 Tax=Pyrus ussuriensis x Pyrus communis TaxID=2448454 RepID=A0A5N5HQ07_9ROSA|nr:hypothetical protein D8674_007485 [Pyrus ussuriensis x Pyrus communis]